MNPLLQAALEIQRFLQDAGEQFCFIGALALQRWGEPRFTRDVDLTLLCDLGHEEAAAQRILSAFKGRIEDALAFALRTRVVLVESKDGIPIDIALGALPFERRCVERAVEFDFGGDCPLRVCCAEDLVVLKAFAGRTRDWADIEMVLVRNRGKLRWETILAELEPLLEARESPENLKRLLELKRAVER